MTTRIRPGIPFGLAVGLACGWLGCGTALAQQTANPPGFDPYGAPYRAYAFPGAGNNPAITNSQISPRPLTSINNFAQAVGNDDGFGNGEDSNPFGGGGRGRRFDSSYRRYDRTFGREFNANGKSDSAYLADRQRREDLQLKMLKETDPAKRDELKKELEKSIDRSESPNDDTANPYVSSRRGSSSSTSVAASGARRTSPSATAARAGAGKPVDPRRYQDAAPSPSSVLERSRRMGSVGTSEPKAPSLDPR